MSVNRIPLKTRRNLIQLCLGQDNERVEIKRGQYRAKRSVRVWVKWIAGLRGGR